MARVKSLRVLLLAAGWLLALGGWGTPGLAAEYSPLPPAAPTGITPDWLIHDAARNRLIIYLPGYHAPAHAYYQWVRVQPGQAFPLSFTAQPGLSIFLDNQLLFTARAASTYSLDLGQLVPPNAGPGPRLLGVWQPEGSPVLASFSGSGPAREGQGTAKADAVQVQARLPGPQGQNVFLSFLLLLGLLYGGVRTTYQSGMARIFQVEELFSSGSDQQSFLTKPAFSLLNLVLVLLFALSFALLLTAIRTDLYNLPLLRRFFDVPETAIVGRVLLYTAVITGYVLGKYLYVGLLAYIFRPAGSRECAVPRVSAHHPAGGFVSAAGSAAAPGP